jgi:hypothetical protein
MRCPGMRVSAFPVVALLAVTLCCLRLPRRIFSPDSAKTSPVALYFAKVVLFSLTSLALVITRDLGFLLKLWDRAACAPSNPWGCSGGSELRPALLGSCSGSSASRVVSLASRGLGCDVTFLSLIPSSSLQTSAFLSLSRPAVLSLHR